MAGLLKKGLEYFGFADEAEQLPTRQELTPVRSARVTPIRSARRSSTDVSEIYTIEPRSYSEAGELAAHYRLGIPVIVNMGDMSEADSKRMLDFMLGLKEGLEGHLKRVTSKVFLLTPATVSVNDEELAESEPYDDLLVRP